MEVILKKIFLFLMKKLYPWYDYTNFYAIMADWLEHAYPHYVDKAKIFPSSKETAQSMGIAASACRSISYDSFDYGVASEEMKEQQVKLIADILISDSLGWWD